MKILIIGTGYVGLVTGACFAEMGHQVICLDIDPKKISLLKQGQIPIYEPGLQEIVTRSQKAGRLQFTTSYEEGLKAAPIIFLCLPTPSDDEGRADLSALEKAVDTIQKSGMKPLLIVNKSTSPVGTAAALEKRLGICPIASNPEFLKEGNAVADCMKPDRIILGCEDPKSLALLRQIYTPFSVNHDRILTMDRASAEMTKYAANAMLATRISFMNEMASICERVGANINQVRVGIGSDKRIGYDFLYAGVGYGGSCFPKDLKALKSLALDRGCSTDILDAVESVNARQKRLLGEKLLAYFEKEGGLLGKTIAVWGVSFKPETDDIREAPALELIQELLSQGARVKLFDPIALSNAKEVLGENPSIEFCENEYNASQEADAIALVTEWKQFRTVDLDRIRLGMKGKALFDGRNQYKPREMEERGFDYFGIGLG